MTTLNGVRLRPRPTPGGAFDDSIDDSIDHLIDKTSDTTLSTYGSGPMDELDDGGPSATAPAGQVRLARRLPQIPITSSLPTYAGLAIAAIGFAVIAIGWGQLAALNNVALQLPYVMSAGLPGLGLVAVGVTIVNGWARRQDAAKRERQLVELAAAVRDLRALLEQR